MWMKHCKYLSIQGNADCDLYIALREIGRKEDPQQNHPMPEIEVKGC